MDKQYAQVLLKDEAGSLFIEGDWFPWPLPKNIQLDTMAYPDTSYSFTTFFSKKTVGFQLGYASGNYGHSLFTTGENGEIIIGNYVVLQSVRIVCNHSVRIKDHCMFSWGSVITDTWPAKESLMDRRKLLEKAATSKNRHIEDSRPAPVIIHENVWVGFEAIILPGVTIGRGAVIGCKTVVSHDVPPYAVVVGNPARVLKFLHPTDTPQVRAEAIKDFANHQGY